MLTQPILQCQLADKPSILVIQRQSSALSWQVISSVSAHRAATDDHMLYAEVVNGNKEQVCNVFTELVTSMISKKKAAERRIVDHGTFDSGSEDITEDRRCLPAFIRLLMLSPTADNTSSTVWQSKKVSAPARNEDHDDDDDDW